MFIKKVVFPILFLSVLFYVFPQDQNGVQKDKDLRLENFLKGYYENDLRIKDMVVKIDTETVAISGTPDFRDKGYGTGQIVLAIAGAGVAVPRSRNIVFAVQFLGMPFGFIEVPTRKALLVSEGKISGEDFIRSFISTQLPVPFNFPEDLLTPVIGSSDTWMNSRLTVCDAVKIGELLNVKVDDFLPELLDAAYVGADPEDGSEQNIIAVMDMMNEKDAGEFLKLNENDQMGKRIVRIGTVIYIVKGTEDVIENTLSVLIPKPEQKIVEEKDVKEEAEKEELPDIKTGNDESDNKGYYIIGGVFLFLFAILVFIFIQSGKGKRK